MQFSSGGVKFCQILRTASKTLSFPHCFFLLFYPLTDNLHVHLLDCHFVILLLFDNNFIILSTYRQLACAPPWSESEKSYPQQPHNWEKFTVIKLSYYPSKSSKYSAKHWNKHQNKCHSNLFSWKSIFHNLYLPLLKSNLIKSKSKSTFHNLYLPLWKSNLIKFKSKSTFHNLYLPLLWKFTFRSQSVFPSERRPCNIVI